MSNQIVKNSKGIIKISVRNLVEFILREGDIDNRHGKTASPEAMQEGSRIHRKIQRRMGSNYHPEVPLKIAIEEEDYTLVVEGRAEGTILHSASGKNGFGYDPLFYYTPLEKTFADLSSEEKNEISHRARTMQQILPILEEVL